MANDQSQIMGDYLQSEKKEDRPLYVKSQNFRHGIVMRYPEEPPTDKQLKYILKLKKLNGISRTVKIPRNRKQASLIIEAILRGDF